MPAVDDFLFLPGMDRWQLNGVCRDKPAANRMGNGNLEQQEQQQLSWRWNERE
jgi:hypothetical protein